MRVNGKHYKTIDFRDGNLYVINQTLLPFEFKEACLKTSDDIVYAIKSMIVRGAPLIGVTAAYGVYFAFRESGCQVNDHFRGLVKYIKGARPTAVNLMFAVDSIVEQFLSYSDKHNADLLLEIIFNYQAYEEQASLKMGNYGYELIRQISENKGGAAVNILTHCNAGWLATIDYGTATAPMYVANERGIKLHIWVDETRPRNQGGRLTAWELYHENIPHTIIVDNLGGHLMQHNQVDMVIVGCDRATSQGDVANKVGTYLKALAAKANNVPFYVALPFSSIDFSLNDGVAEIDIEEREEEEVSLSTGYTLSDKKETIFLNHPLSKSLNIGFDVTPASLIDGFITDKGVFKKISKELSIL